MLCSYGNVLSRLKNRFGSFGDKACVCFHRCVYVCVQHTVVVKSWIQITLIVFVKHVQRFKDACTCKSVLYTNQRLTY